jgi:uncharacterized protein (TIGR00251 family)
MRLEVRVQPRAGRDQLVGWQEDGCLKVKLKAPPVDGEANAALVVFLAHQLGLARSRITLLRGDTAHRKLLEIPLEEGEVRRLLEASQD